MIVVICRSGKRSAKAIHLLHKMGYTNVYSVIDGFESDKSKVLADNGQRTVNGWKNNGLPWTYALNENKMHFE
ncbi:rhodanese-like domain-containing protein [Candidatus Reidiella endopervernicosa]|uniref:Rhodanese domain-containing protein n=2 Tax=Gammaproteobacteria incertae sedis TaxID=118884 RepID=A0A6N0HX69_9GAMM|nr:rhodanese-like domain-containing protein [Candidatus Reidiella endopervernicosa]QKQ26716.1 hypothetical protein HUE57_10805 [Candidatus Reidiella endopervernicosa]